MADLLSHCGCNKNIFHLEAAIARENSRICCFSRGNNFSGTSPWTMKSPLFRKHEKWGVWSKLVPTNGLILKKICIHLYPSVGCWGQRQTSPDKTGPVGLTVFTRGSGIGANCRWFFHDSPWFSISPFDLAEAICPSCGIYGIYPMFLAKSWVALWLTPPILGPNSSLFLLLKSPFFHDGIPMLAAAKPGQTLSRPQLPRYGAAPASRELQRPAGRRPAHGKISSLLLLQNVRRDFHELCFEDIPSKIFELCPFGAWTHGWRKVNLLKTRGLHGFLAMRMRGHVLRWET